MSFYLTYILKNVYKHLHKDKFHIISTRYIFICKYLYHCNFRLLDLHNRPRIGGQATNNLALLRERVERQRSVVLPHLNKTGSLEELNSGLKTDVDNTRSSVDRLDSQISTLHQDVATLSMEVQYFIFFVYFFENVIYSR